MFSRLISGQLLQSARQFRIAGGLSFPAANDEAGTPPTSLMLRLTPPCSEGCRGRSDGEDKTLAGVPTLEEATGSGVCPDPAWNLDKIGI